MLVARVQDNGLQEICLQENLAMCNFLASQAAIKVTLPLTQVQVLQALIRLLEG